MSGARGAASACQEDGRYRPCHGEQRCGHEQALPPDPTPLSLPPRFPLVDHPGRRSWYGLPMNVKPIDNLEGALRSAYPELDVVHDVAGGKPVYLVGGAVRDLLLGKGRSDIDLVIEGDATALAGRLGGEVVEHERFATAKARLGGHEVDIATARAETYPHPGSLPEVEPTAGIAADLARRDFTINAMAIPLRRDPELIDPHRGQEDLEAGLLRILHSRSFEDDPTRALRAARYVARLDLELEPDTAELLSQTDLSTVSADRRNAELLRLAGETEAVRGFGLLAEWGLIEPDARGLELAARLAGLLTESPWAEGVRRDQAILAAVLGRWGRAEELAAARPRRPSEAVRLARSAESVELAIARTMGADWIDRYLREWRSVELEIDGDDLIAAGMTEGPQIGVGLAEALGRKLDGELSGREAELAVAMQTARKSE
jgi:tRNA nucleotidyltransferase (CCA-adding enzyme)